MFVSISEDRLGRSGLICLCIYHSAQWAELVEQHWVTMFVDHDIATMWRRFVI